jgi:hypothetical protein
MCSPPTASASASHAYARTPAREIGRQDHRSGVDRLSGAAGGGRGGRETNHFFDCNARACARPRVLPSAEYVGPPRSTRRAQLYPRLTIGPSFR